MAERTVALGAISYRSSTGAEQVGLFGAVVEVHEEDLERFDRLNSPMEPIEEPELDAALLAEIAARRGDASAPEDLRPSEETDESHNRRQRRRT